MSETQKIHVNSYDELYLKILSGEIKLEAGKVIEIIMHDLE
jgi:hypothetical protein